MNESSGSLAGTAFNLLDWLHSISLWCAQQQAYWAAVYLCLCFSLGLSFIVLAAVNPLLVEFRKTQAHWFILIFLLAKGMCYVPFFIPLAAIFDARSQQVYSLVFQVFETAALTSAILALFMWRWKGKPQRGILLFLAPLVIIWYVTCLFPDMAEQVLLPAYKHVLNLCGCVAVIWHLRNKNENGMPQLRWCIVGWMCFTGIDYAVWDFDFPVGGAWGAYRLVCWAAGAFGLSIATIGFSRFLITRDFKASTGVTKKSRHSRQMLIIEWVCTMIVFAFAGWGSEAMVKNFYTDVVGDAQQSVVAIRNHIAGFEGRLQTLMSIANKTTKWKDIFANEDKRKKALELLSRYTKGIDNLVCYVADADGNVLAQTDEDKARAITGNYKNAPYMRDALAGEEDIGYMKASPEAEPTVFASMPVMNEDRSKLLGVVVFQSVLEPEEMFGLYKNAFLFDVDKKIMLTGNSAYERFEEKDFLAKEAINFERFTKTDPDNKILKINDAFYVYSTQELNDEGAMVAILYEAKPLLISCGILYVTLTWLLIFIICIFIFTRYVLARCDMELEQAQELRDILDCTPNCVALLDKNLRCLRIDGSGVGALDIDARTLVGRAFVDIWTKLDSFFILGQLKKVFMGEKTAFEVIYKHPDGTPRNFSIFCGPLYNAAQKVDKIVTVWADITRQKKIESELFERFQLEKTLSAVTQIFLSSAHVESALKGALHALLVFSDAERVSWFEVDTDMKKAVCTLTEKRFQEAIDVFDRQMSFEGAWEHWMTLLARQRCVYKSADKEDGEVLELMKAENISQLLAVPVFVEGKFTGIVRVDYPAGTRIHSDEQTKPILAICATLQENLQRWKIQEELQLLNTAVQNATEGILIAKMQNEQPEIVFVNSAVTRISGYEKEKLVGRSLMQAFEGPKTDPKMPEHMLASLNKNEHYHIEVLQKHMQGHEYLAELNMAPICDSVGKVMYAVVTQKDITAKRDLETRSTLTSKLESIGQLAAGIAHEINTPAQFISDNLHFIKQNWKPLEEALAAGMQNPTPVLARIVKEMPGAIGDALEGVQRISSIVQAMREFSHAGGEKSGADINSAILTTIAVGRNEWKYCADITTELEEDMPTVSCFIGDINQVVLNLVINSAHAIAEKFPAGEKGSITVRTSHTPEHAIIEVEDNGAGIPENIRQKIFDPFFTTKPQGKGTGQGLYIAHRIIVDKHQGTIEVTSVVGKGTKFTIKLPMAV